MTEYRNLVIQPALGPPKQIVWAVRRNAPQLHDALNAWLRNYVERVLDRFEHYKAFVEKEPELQ